MGVFPTVHARCNGGLGRGPNLGGIPLGIQPHAHALPSLPPPIRLLHLGHGAPAAMGRPDREIRSEARAGAAGDLVRVDPEDGRVGVLLSE